MLYVPDHFKADDRSTLREFIRAYDFATLVTPRPDGPIVTHLPMLLRTTGEHDVLVGHVARANPHWRRMDEGVESLAIFHGPHGYVSPSWYATTPAVPTWNYAVVHARGVARVEHDEAFTAGVLDELVTRYEAQRATPWSAGTNPPEFTQKLQKAIVAFVLPIAALDGKFKLGQNRSPADLDGVTAGLEHDDTPASRALADFMRRYAGGR